MRKFTLHELETAIQYAKAGGQSLHLHTIIGDRSRAPRCFVAAVDRGEQIAHLFDQNETRLTKTVRQLGVRVVVVERRGTDRQHVDLCGVPLRKAVAMSENYEAGREFGWI